MSNPDYRLDDEIAAWVFLFLIIFGIIYSLFRLTPLNTFHAFIATSIIFCIVFAMYKAWYREYENGRKKRNLSSTKPQRTKRTPKPKKTCKHCKATGSNPSGEMCWSCWGHGYVPHKPPIENDNTRVTCGFCNGTGVYYDKKDKTCSECNAYGYLLLQRCGTCNGTGEVTITHTKEILVRATASERAHYKTEYHYTKKTCSNCRGIKKALYKRPEPTSSWSGYGGDWT